MATAGIILGVVTLVSNIADTIVGGYQGYTANEIAAKQAEIAAEQLKINKSQYELERQNSYLNAASTVTGYERTISDLEASKIQYGTEIRDAQSQVGSYDTWLANYSSQYAQEVQSKQTQIDQLTASRTIAENNAQNEIDSYDRWLGNYEGLYAQEVQSKQTQTDQLTASGKEAYQNFLNAIGYADALAGATGRAGAGTSQASAAKALDKKLVDYAGEDRTLDADGGLYGSQLTAANMEMDQLKKGLETQRQEALAGKNNIIENLSITGEAFNSQLTAANMEMGQLKTDLELQKQEALANKNNILTNLSTTGELFNSQLTAANMEMGQLKTGLEIRKEETLADKSTLQKNLETSGVLYNSQLTAANMEMDQLKLDLELQRQEMEANRANVLESISDWEAVLALTDRNIADSTLAKNELEQFIEMNFSDLGPQGRAIDVTPSKIPLRWDGAA
jgi:hypothetical protein